MDQLQKLMQRPLIILPNEGGPGNVDVVQEHAHFLNFFLIGDIMGL